MRFRAARFKREPQSANTIIGIRMRSVWNLSHVCPAWIIAAREETPIRRRTPLRAVKKVQTLCRRTKKKADHAMTLRVLRVWLTTNPGRSFTDCGDLNDTAVLLKLHKKRLPWSRNSGHSSTRRISGQCLSMRATTLLVPRSEYVIEKPGWWSRVSRRASPLLIVKIIGLGVGLGCRLCRITVLVDHGENVAHQAQTDGLKAPGGKRRTFDRGKTVFSPALLA